MVALNQPAGPSPLRRPGSIRRTSTIDTIWPDGPGKPMRMRGKGRDLRTHADGSAEVLGEASTEILATIKREILELASTPGAPELQRLLGPRPGGYSRRTLGEILAEEKDAGELLYWLMDDYAGASLVASWALTQWSKDALKALRAEGGTKVAGKGGVMVGVCAGFRPGASTLWEDGTSRSDRAAREGAPVGPIVNPEDPQGWHVLSEQQGLSARRARRLDVWREGDVVQIEAGFQDSAGSPEGHRVAIHEYRVHAKADPETMELLDLSVTPSVLPHSECLEASPNASRMLGQDLAGMRGKVVEMLPGPLGCTHLNDILRSLADVGALARKLG